MEQCCGTTCDRSLLEAEFKVAGAQEFVNLLEGNIKEDCSTSAISSLLARYRTAKLGLRVQGARK